MSRSKSFNLLFLFLAFAVSGEGIPFAEAEQKTITVGNTSELVNAIGSHRTIKLKPGTYGPDFGIAVSNPNVFMHDVDYYSPKELVIQNVEDLSLEGDPNGLSVLETKRLSTVLRFEKSKKISLKNLVLSYAVEEKETRGKLIAFEEVEDASLRDVKFQCNGANAIWAAKSKRISLERVNAEKCDSIAEVSDSANVSFTESSFRENKGAFYFSNSQKVTFDHVNIEGNEGISVFDFYQDQADVTVNNSEIVNNKVSELRSGNGTLAINNSRVINSGTLKAALKSSLAPEVLETGSFAGDSVTTKTGDEWFGLFERAAEAGKPVRYELKKVKVIVKQVDLQVTDGVEVSTAEKEQPLFLVRGLPSFSEGEIKTVHVAPRGTATPIQLGHEEYLDFGDDYLLGSEGVASQSSGGGEGYLSISNYHLSLKRKPKSGFAKPEYKQLLSFDFLESDNEPPALVWAGDLDKDNRLDLLLETGGEGSFLMLFLSSIAEDKSGLPVPACQFGDSVGC